METNGSENEMHRGVCMTKPECFTCTDIKNCKLGYNITGEEKSDMEIKSEQDSK